MALEIERKFLIKNVDENFLLSLGARLFDIEQIYLLPTLEFPVRRIRRRAENGVKEYFYTEKRPTVGAFSREEQEYKIDENMYLSLQKERDFTLNTINKKRYVLPYEKRILEIDVFPFFKEFFIMEIELKSEDEEFSIPSFFEIIEEVTLDFNYTNIALAKKNFS